MQVFKLYFKLLKSVAPSLGIYAVIFSILILMMTANQTKSMGAFEETQVNTALVNYDEDSLIVQDFVNFLSEFCDFEDYGDNEKDLIDALVFRRVDYIITIPYGFGDDLLAGKEVFVEKKTTPGGIYSASLDNAINSYLNTAKIYLNSVENITEADLVSNIGQDMKVETKVTIEPGKSSDLKDQFYNSYYNMASFVLLSCCLLGVGMVMLSFHNIDIRRRNMVTPMTNKDMNVALICGNIIFVLAFDIFFIILGFFINKDKQIDTGVLLFWLNMIIFSISALSISFLVAIFVKKREVNDAISYVMPLGLSFISGAFIPQNLLGESVLNLAKFSPLYWFIKGNNSIAVLSNYNWSYIKDIFIYMSIQLGFAAAIFAVALVVSKQINMGS